VQVVITEPEVGGVERLQLQDETGVFLQTKIDSERDAKATEEPQEPDQTRSERDEDPLFTLESL